MKLTIARPTSLCLKSLMQATVPTINHRVRGLLGDILEKSVIEGILTRAREIRILIRNDATATLRLIELSPARDAEYRMLWAAQANKLTAEIAATIAKATKSFGSKVEEDNLFTAEEVGAWAIPMPPQKSAELGDFKLPDAKAAAAAAEAPEPVIPDFSDEAEEEEAEPEEDENAPVPVHGAVG